jgi:medium-chain acyl-CoA synthetase
VESTLKTLPYIVESAVVSSPNAQRSELVKAFVVLTNSHRNHDPVVLTKEIQDYCKKNATPYKYPRKIEFVDQGFLPKTISGKIRRKELKRMEWENYEKGKKGRGREIKL